MTDRDEKGLADLQDYKLDPYDMALLKLTLEYPAITARELAEHTGIGQSTIERRRLRPAFQKALRQLFLEPLDTIREAIQEVARRYVKLAKSENEAVSERACRQILLSAGILKNRLQIDDSPTEQARYEILMGLVKRLEKRVKDEETQNENA